MSDLKLGVLGLQEIKKKWSEVEFRSRVSDPGSREVDLEIGLVTDVRVDAPGS
jgi:hypothetical protein